MQPLLGYLILFATALALLILLGAVFLSHRLARPPRLTAGVALARGLPADPEEAGFTYSTITLDDPTRPPHEYWLIPGAAPTGPLFILIHGWGDSRLGALNWLPLLLPMASHCALYDQRGHGESLATSFGWGSEEARDLTLIAHDLRRRFPDRPLVLFAWSMGCEIALTASPEIRPAAVICDSPYLNAQAAVSAMLRQMRLPARLLVPPAFALRRIIGPGFRSPPLPQLAADAQCPMLLLHGVADVLTPVTDAQRIADAAHASLHTYPEADHLQAAWLHPDQYQNDIRAFLTQTPQIPHH